ncbi:TorF family putative porin [Asticcacaulis solisilvae]|uniref:TorF family putative porin n=1 Tax=Asticcacaulis solisilvae TaxID=1217274 RepID=UPI003FD83405
MKKSLLVAAVALSALFAGSAAMAQDKGSLSYNLELTNNYVWRGVSQTNGNAALQGGIDYKKGMFYAGTWLSNVDFVAPKGENANTEADLYLGITPTVGNWSYDFGVIYYTYPSADSATTGELKAAVSHPMGKGSIGVAMYLPTETLEKPYYEVNASYPLSSKWSVSGAIANYESARYTTWNAGVTYALTDHLALDLRYSEAEKMPNNLYATLKASF